MTAASAARAIDVRKTPLGEPPYQGRRALDITHGDWQIKVTRYDADPLAHCIAIHQDTGIVHAERLDVTTRGQVKAWADGLPDRLNGAAA